MRWLQLRKFRSNVVVEWRAILLPVPEALIEISTEKLIILTDIFRYVHQSLQTNGSLLQTMVGPLPFT
jgi:hypothetical protein